MFFHFSFYILCWCRTQVVYGFLTFIFTVLTVADVHLSGICYSLFTLPLVVNTHFITWVSFLLLVW